MNYSFAYEIFIFELKNNYKKLKIKNNFVSGK